MSAMGCRIDRDRIKSSMNRGIARGIEGAMAALAAASKEQAPTDSGRMIASMETRLSGDGLGGSVGYGAAYAAIQHENTALRHGGGKKSKFLADPAADPAIQAAMLNALAEGCRSEMG